MTGRMTRCQQVGYRVSTQHHLLFVVEPMIGLELSLAGARGKDRRTGQLFQFVHMSNMIVVLVGNPDLFNN